MKVEGKALMHQVPYAKLEKGTLLVASPEIEAGFFSRAVVLVCEHSPNGSFGLTINKSLHVELPSEILNQDHLNNPRIEVRAGGPVQGNQMMLLHTASTIPGQTLEVCPGVFLGGDLHFLQEAVSNSEGPDMRLCFGYAGWGAGQLEQEFLEGGWFIYPGAPKHIFQVPLHRIWQSVLRDMGGRYASLSTIPEDLTVN